MPCGCKHKRGSGRAKFLSGVTWSGYKTGKGKVFSGSGIYKKRRKKKGSGYAGSTPRMKRIIDQQTVRWAKESPALRAGTSSGFHMDRMMANNAARMGLTVNKGGSGVYKKRRKKRGSGMGMSGGGINFSGSGASFTGGALRWVVNKKRNGRKVI